MLRVLGSRLATQVCLCLLFMTACSSSSDGGGNGPPPTVVAVFEGVLADTGGASTGTLSLEFLSDNTGSGSFQIGQGLAQTLDVVVNGTGFTASGGGLTFTGGFTTNDLSGSYTSANGGGLAAALKKVTGVPFVKYCASHSGSDSHGSIVGAVAVVWNPSSNAIHGVWSTVGSTFRGVLTGAAGNNNALMSGHPEPVTLQPDSGPPPSLGGVYSLGSGESGTMAGGACP